MRSALLMVTLAAAALAQRPVFEVSSVKPNAAGDVAGFNFGFTPDGGVTSRNFSAWNLIRTAFNLRDLQIRGGPSWIKSQGFDLQAKPGQVVPRDQTLLMLQSLLVDRFGLRFHRETRLVPSYSLTILATGSKLQPVHEGRARTRLGDLDAPSMTLTSLCQILEFELDRPVVNRTGREDSFSIRLQWASERADKGADGLEKPSLFTAVQEQLGLRLDSDRALVELFVIDALERPTEN